MVVSRDYILREVRRTAQENGGKPLGRGRFEEVTGIRQGDVARYWARWGDACREAGFTPNVLQGRHDDEAVLALLVAEIRRLGRYPTVTEMRPRRREDATFPAYGVIARFGTQPEQARRVADYCQDRPADADVLAIVTPLLAQEPVPRDGDEGPAVLGSVYLMKWDRYYKIGFSNAVGRREYEVTLQMPGPVKVIHSIATDDPAGIEAYWHRRFAARRRGRSEWFDLTPEDIAAFRRRKKFM